MANGRDIGPIATNERDRILRLVEGGKLYLEFAVQGDFARYDTARRCGGSVAFYRGDYGRIHLGIPGESQVVVSRVIDVRLAVDVDGVTADAGVSRKVRVLQAELLHPLVLCQQV